MDSIQRRTTRRDFLKLAGLSGAAALLAACGGAPAAAPTTAPAAATNAPAAGATSAPTGAAAAPPAANATATINIFDFGGDNDKKIYADAIARFNKTFPNVKVIDNFTPVTTWSDYSNKITTQVAGGQAPDVIHIAIEGNRLIVSKGLLVPMDDYLNKDAGGKELIDDIAPALTDSLKVGGKQMLLPDSWNNMVIYYNTKMFKEAGIAPPKEDWTWDDFLATAKKLTKGEGDNKVYGFGIAYFNFGLTPWLLTNGTYQLTDDWSKSNLNDPKVAEAVQFVHDLVYVHKVSPDVKGTDNVNLMASGKLAMSAWGHWPIQDLTKQNFTDFDVQYWPRKTAATTVFGVGGWGISKDGKNKDTAWEVIKSLTSKETIQASADAGVAIPARRSVAESSQFLKFPGNAKIFYGSLKDAKPVASPANFNELESIMNRHWDEVMADTAKPADAMKAAHDELTASFAQMK